MRIVRATVLLTALTLFAASCSSDSGGAATTGAKVDTTAVAADTAAPDTAAPDATASETTDPDTTDPETTVAPVETPPAAAEGVTVGPDDRLIPAPCQGDNVADEASGVAADSVNVASLSIDFETLAAIGFAASGTDIRQFFQVLVDDLNAKGGVCGRTINYQGVLYDRLANEGGKGCLQVTKDVTTLIVLSQGGTPEAVCAAETGAVTYSQHDFSKVATDGVIDHLFVAYPTVDDQYRATIEYAIQTGQLEGKKVGVWYGGIFPDQNEAFEKGSIPLLDAAGIDYKAFRTDFSGPNDPQGNAALLAAATEFASSKIDVLLDFTGTTNHTGIQNELAAQGVIPIWIGAPRSANSSNEIFAKAAGVEQIANGEQVISFTKSISDVQAGDNKALASCHKQFTALGLPAIPEKTFDYSAAANMCFQFDMVVAALSVAGGDLSRETMARAMEQLPPQVTARSFNPQQFTAEQHFSVAKWGILNYDGATNTYSTGENFELEG